MHTAIVDTYSCHGQTSVAVLCLPSGSIQSNFTAIKQAQSLTAKRGRESSSESACVFVCKPVGVCVNRQMWEDEDKLDNEASAAWQISESYAILDAYLNIEARSCFVCVCVSMWVLSLAEKAILLFFNEMRTFLPTSGIKDLSVH